MPSSTAAATEVTAADQLGSKKSRKKSKKDKKKNASSALPVTQADADGEAGEGPTKGQGSKVHVEGMKVTPLKDFASANMPPEVMKYVTLRGWKEPTQIQAHCWPVLNSGRDVVGIAETGSGKTLTFSLPAMARIFKRSQVMCSGHGGVSNGRILGLLWSI